MTSSKPTIREKLELSRRELLDLSLRNPLVSYRTLKAKGVEIINGLSAEIYQILVEEDKRMSFLPIREKDNDDGQEPSATSKAEENSDRLVRRLTKRHLQTPYTSGALQARLLKTYYAARTAIEEKGVNLLYLALGMVRWYESDSSEEERSAPVVLVPVELERSDVRQMFRVKYTGDEISTNLSFQTKLRQEFNMKFPKLPAGEFKISRYLASVKKAVSKASRWDVDQDAIILGFFSFNGLLMYEDLDSRRWPPNRKPANNHLLKSLLGDGFKSFTATIGDEDNLDKHLPVSEIKHVVDADSSQTLAIIDVISGRNLVIQGPPGTGKSQTITNLIAGAVGQGKKVLFVSEKMAALGVVSRNLQRVGLGAACLELHSHKTRKKAVLEELERTLHLEKPRATSLDHLVNTLGVERDRLNDYCEAVNSEIGKSGITPIRAYGEILQIGYRLQEAGSGLTSADELPRPELPEALKWTGLEARQRETAIQELQDLIQEIGMPSQHPFWGSNRRVYVGFTDRRPIFDTATAAIDSLGKLRRAADEIAGVLLIDNPQRFSQVDRLGRSVNVGSQAPDLHEIEVASCDWVTSFPEIQECCGQGQRLVALRAKYDNDLAPQAWEQDLSSCREGLVAYGSTWWRALVPRWWRARGKLAGLMSHGLPHSNLERVAVVDAILKHQRIIREVEAHSELMRRLFGRRWRGPGSDWGNLQHIAIYLNRIHERVQTGELNSELIAALERASGPPISGEKYENLCVNSSDSRNALAAAFEVVDFDADKRFGQSVDDVPLNDLESLFISWTNAVDDLQQIVQYNHRANILDELGLSGVVHLANEWPEAGNLLVESFRASWYGRLAAQSITLHPELAQFNGRTHETVRKGFVKHDRLLIERNREQVALAHWQKLPPATDYGRTGVLLHELEKRKRHMPIRQLIKEAGEVIQAIKPVFMMSPLSVAAFIPPDSVVFDLVIFDEASQVKPVDAFGALLRAKQAVVVGDSKQLPPTSFFDKAGDDENDDTESETRDLESILGLFVGKGAHSRLLRWHYRSRHDSLIAVSNREFYDDKLVTFPASGQDVDALGVRFRHFPNTTYDRGSARSVNLGEAREVAKAVMRHAAEAPHLSLGVAAFSQHQMQAILDELENLRQKDTRFEDFFMTKHPTEPFFVKNLENVQGDERDAIFISVGFGRDLNGYVSMNFGPLNKAGGERRLNVLITRAKCRCDVFTNMTDSDIDLERSNARGVIALKRYLAFAQHGHLDVPLASGRDYDSPFEESVARALRAHGYDPVPQVGSGGFFIDLGIRDPRAPGRFLLGVECDGAPYHSSKWARDRDRLRQEVLEGLGWTIHRVWSTDWYRSPERELRRLLEAVKKAKARPRPRSRPREIGPPSGSDSEAGLPIERLPTQLKSSPKAARYDTANISINLNGSSILGTPAFELAAWITEVVSIESPVHRDEAVGRVAAAAGTKVGSAIRQRLLGAVKIAESHGSIRSDGEFLWDAFNRSVMVRDRSELPRASRKTQLIAPEEIEKAVVMVAAAGMGMRRDELAVQACRLFGFARVTEQQRLPVEEVISAAIKRGRLRNDGGVVVVVEDAPAKIRQE